MCGHPRYNPDCSFWGIWTRRSRDLSLASIGSMCSEDGSRVRAGYRSGGAWFRRRLFACSWRKWDISNNILGSIEMPVVCKWLLEYRAKSAGALTIARVKRLRVLIPLVSLNFPKSRQKSSRAVHVSWHQQPLLLRSGHGRSAVLSSSSTCSSNKRCLDARSKTGNCRSLPVE